MTSQESRNDDTARDFEFLIEENSLGDAEPFSEEEFAQEVRELVDEGAPGLFALVEEYGVRDDAWVYAWGIAFDDRVEVVNVSGTVRRIFTSVDHAYRRCSQLRKIRLVWANPVTPRPELVT